MNSVVKNIDWAKKATDYARGCILKGATQLENNELPLKEFASLVNLVNVVREKQSDSSNYLFLDKPFASLLASVDYSENYRVGSCGEFSALGLWYLETKEQLGETNVEVFEIVNGDHAFLVIGRNKNSDPRNPLTWGENAIICDIWNNDYFLASQYQNRLKNYFFSLKERNCIQPVNNNHILSPSIYPSGFEIRSLHNPQKKEELLASFRKQVEILIDQHYTNKCFLSMHDSSDAEIYRALNKIAELKTLANASVSNVFLEKDNNNYLLISKSLTEEYQKIKKNIFDAYGRISDKNETAVTNKETIKRHATFLFKVHLPAINCSVDKKSALQIAQWIANNADLLEWKHSLKILYLTQKLIKEPTNANIIAFNNLKEEIKLSNKNKPKRPWFFSKTSLENELIDNMTKVANIARQAIINNDQKDHNALNERINFSCSNGG